MVRTSRRLGAAILFLLWAQVATANALPCAISCWMEIDTVHHHHTMGDEHHQVGHHIAGPKLSAPEHCGAPQLLVAVVVPPEFPLPPSAEIVVRTVSQSVPQTFHAAVPEFATPPPRA